MQYRLISEEELRHHGIKGQKWGVRRYQNEDGSLTSKGKQRYGTKENFEKQYPEDVKKNMRKTKAGIDAGAHYIGKAKESVKESRYKANKKEMTDAESKARKNAYKMTDAELRDAVNRLNMEERYIQVMKEREYVAVGKSKVEKYMDYTLTALSVAGTALSIATAVKELQK